jgi:uncharacterized membrane protein
MLAEYERLVPGAAERIMRSFEQEGEHRRALEVRAASETFAYRRRGQTIGGFVAGGMIITAGAAVWFGHAAVAITALTTVAALVGVFVLRRPPQRPIDDA